MTEKRCADCGIVKPAADFYKHRTGAGGLHTYCKPCTRARAVAARQRRIDEVREYDRQRYYADRERKLVALRERYAEDPDFRAQVLERERQRRERLGDDPDFIERRRQARRKHDESPAGLLNRRNAAENRRARQVGAFVEEVDRNVVLLMHGGLCGICGLSVDPDDFHVDHIVPLAVGGEHSYANTQPAHPVCNWRKGARVPAERG